jgi:dTDP-4-amino-4,6-dideoxygalactose transaminase
MVMNSVSAQIPLLDVRRQTAAIRAELDAAIATVLDHSQFILGPEVAQLETQIAALCNTKFAVACASGSDALLLPLMALGIRPGDKAITTPFTFFASAGSIARAGATPLFVDIDPDTFNMDPVALERLLTRLSADEIRSIRAIMPVHLFGQCADMKAINAIADRFGIPVIEDAAQAIGAKQGNLVAGSMGLCGCFSFFPSKNLGGLGDGGIITTNDPALAEKLRLLRVHGSGATYHHQLAGINSRLDTLQAAVLLVKLRHLDHCTAARRAHAALYRELLSGPEFQAVGLPVERGGMWHVYNQFTVRVADRDAVRTRLADQGVGSAVYYPLPLHLQPCFAELGYREGDFPESERAAQEVLSLPVEQGLSATDVQSVTERLYRAVGSG